MVNLSRSLPRIPRFWRRITFDYPSWVHVQQMDDTLTGYSASLDAQKNTLALTTSIDRNWRADFVYNRPDEDDLILDGTVNGHKQHMDLKKMNSAQFPLIEPRISLGLKTTPLIIECDAQRTNALPPRNQAPAFAAGLAGCARRIARRRALRRG